MKLLLPFIAGLVAYIWAKKSRPKIEQTQPKIPVPTLIPIPPRTPLTPKAPWSLPDRAEPYINALQTAEFKYNLPSGLLGRVAYQESRFRPDIINGTTTSPANAQGIMQIVPRWHPNVNPLDPFAAIDYAGKYLQELYIRFGSWDKALAGYNWGPTILSKTIKNNPTDWFNFLPNETKNYINQIGQDIKLT